MVDIELNGVAHRLAAGSSLHQLLESLELPDQALALAVNRSVVPRERWREYTLQPHDKVDLVRAIGGG
jgi:sulfur carrier protein